MTDLEHAPFVKMGLVVEALWADAVDRPKFYSSMGLNFEKIIGDALAAARLEGAARAAEKAYANGFRRGAEKMRERAARTVLAGSRGGIRGEIADAIRALPLTPEAADEVEVRVLADALLTPEGILGEE